MSEHDRFNKLKNIAEYRKKQNKKLKELLKIQTARIEELERRVNSLRYPNF